jgi:hypothetical protein
MKIMINLINFKNQCFGCIDIKITAETEPANKKAYLRNLNLNKYHCASGFSFSFYSAL